MDEKDFNRILNDFHHCEAALEAQRTINASLREQNELLKSIILKFIENGKS